MTLAVGGATSRRLSTVGVVTIALGLAGYALLMAMVQIRLIPLYRTVRDEDPDLEPVGQHAFLNTLNNGFAGFFIRELAFEDLLRGSGCQGRTRLDWHRQHLSP